MPDYVTMSEMNGLIPTAFLVQALDDDQDGNADATAWAAVLGQVHKQIDGPLGTRFKVPFTNPLPPIVSEAAPIFAAELLYNRRGFADDKNPWTKQASELRKKLDAIAQGALPLTPEIKRTAPAAGIVSETAKTASTRRKTAI